MLWEIADGVVNEIEVALVIGKAGRNIPVEKALEHVAGFTICNDVSARHLRLPKVRRDEKNDAFFDWLHGKWLDGYAILGPAIVTPDEVPDIRELDISTRVNGVPRVSGNTRDMVFGIDSIVSFASRLMELKPGDVITTATPHGDGDEEYLRPGDLVEGEIDALGILRNPVIAQPEPA